MPDTSAEFERIKALIAVSREKVWFDSEKKEIRLGEGIINIKSLNSQQFKEICAFIEQKNIGSGSMDKKDVSEEDMNEGYELLYQYKFICRDESEVELAKFLAQHPKDLKRLGKIADEIMVSHLFGYGLPAIKEFILQHPEFWEGILNMAEAAKEKASDLFINMGLLLEDHPERWHGIVKIFRGTGSKNLKGIKTLADMRGTLNKHPNYWDVLSEIFSSADENSALIFDFGFKIVQNALDKQPEKIRDLFGWFNEILLSCRGMEHQTFKSFSRLKPLFDNFGLQILNTFVLPIARSQKVGTFQILDSTATIESLQGFKSDDDFDVIRFISTSYLTRANVILKDIIIKGIESHAIEIPIGNESEILKEFLENAPAYYIEFYRQFKEIYLGHTGELRNQKVAEIFKDVKQIKEELFRGNLTKDYNKELFYSVLYFVFSCHDMTVPKENYIRTYEGRSDRQSDIPPGFQKPIIIKVSSGGFALKNDKNPVNHESWDLLIRIAREVKEKKDFNVAELGLRFMEAYEKNTLAANREYFMRMAYQHSVNNGESLPDFRLGHDVLMKYKEFVGDRLANDIIFSILKESMTKFPQMFFDSQNRILGKKQDLSGLAKQLSGIIKSPMDTAKKDEILGRILRQNGIHVENTNEILALDQPQLKDWLTKQQPNVIEKGLVTKIFLALYGDEYSQMQSEMSKYDFRKDIRGGGGKEYILLLSKRKGHCVASYSMGVCVAPDNKMWESPDFWPLIIFDKDKNAHGGAIFRTIEEEGNRYLVLSVQPASSILNQAAPEQVLDKIIQFGRVIAKKLKYDNLLIPLSSSIHSNRGSIQAAIAQRFGKTTPLKLKQNYDFSYSPYHYSYQEFYVAY